LLSEVN